MEPFDFLPGLCSSSPDPLLILAAHPDDEVIGAGAHLVHWPEAHIIHVTDGAPPAMGDALNAGYDSRDAYARARKEESQRALALAGISSGQLSQLGFGDQEASLNLVDLVNSLVKVIKELRPRVLMTHPYEGGHPDHDATAFAARAACRLTRLETDLAPLLVEMGSYHNQGGHLITGEFLPAHGSLVLTRVLRPVQRDLKRSLFCCFRSQARVLQWFPIERECFRLAPEYDFTRPPHPGKLYYEMFNWAMMGPRWRALAGAALEQLGWARATTPAQAP